MNKAKFIVVHPVLPVQDVTKAIAYYVDKLGFKLLFQDAAEAPNYAGVGRDNIELHLQWHEPSQIEFVDKLNLRLLIDGIDALFAEYRPQGVFHDRTDLRDTAWGTREFAFFDLDGNGLTFYCDLDQS